MITENKRSNGIIFKRNKVQTLPLVKSPLLNATKKPKPAYKNADRATYLRDSVTGEKYYQCPLCPKRLKGHLTIHLRTHNGHKPWQCSHCNKRFSQKCNLQTHIKSVHEAGQRFKCELCTKSFDYKKNLERHVSSHLHEKPYKCCHCPRRFTAVDWLCKHQREHTGEKPYDCVFCPQVRFAQYTTMINHLRKHIEERPYICKFCGKSYYASGSLSVHIRRFHSWDPETCLFCEKVFSNKFKLFYHLQHTHIGEGSQFYSVKRSPVAIKEKGRKVVKKSTTRYICQEVKCGKFYKKRTSLKRHCLWNHMPEWKRPYSCELCGKFFVDLSCLRNHFVKHTMERAEQCRVCRERFRWKANLKRHLKVVHNKTITTNRLEGFHQCSVCSKRLQSKSQLHVHFEKEHMGKEVVRLERVVI